MNPIIKDDISLTLKYINTQELSELLRKYKDNFILNNPGCIPKPYIICGPETYNVIGNISFAKYNAKILIDYSMRFGEIEIR